MARIHRVAIVTTGLSNLNMGQLVTDAINESSPCRVIAAVPLQVDDGVTTELMLIIEKEKTDG